MKHLTPEIESWIGSGYAWITMAHKTPVDMGFIDVDSMDPRYYDAMEFIHAESARISRELAKNR